MGDPLAAFDTAVRGAGAPPDPDAALAAFDDATSAPAPKSPAEQRVASIARSRLAAHGTSPERVKQRAKEGEPIVETGPRRATVGETVRSGVAAGVAGVGEALGGAVGIAADALTYDQTAPPADPLKFTKLAGAAADDAQRTIRESLGVPKEAITDTSDAVVRTAAALSTPLPLGRAAAIRAATASRGAAKVAEEVAPAAERAVATDAAKLTEAEIDRVVTAARLGNPLRTELPPKVRQAISSGEISGDEASIRQFLSKNEDAAAEAKAAYALESAPEPAGAAPTAPDAEVPTPPDGAQAAATAAETAQKPATASDKVLAALREAKPLRRQQEAIYTSTRGQRLAASVAAREGTSGETGFQAELQPLSGAMDKVHFESLRSKIGQDDVDALFNQVRDSDKLTDWQKLSARRGLAKMFGEYGGQVPQANELDLLDKVFGKDFTDELASKRPDLTRWKQMGLDIANVPRSLMASFDLSAPFRQGAFFVGRPKQFAPAFRDMFKFATSEYLYRAFQEEVAARPTFDLMQQSKLALTDFGRFSAREERFASNLAEKIPVIGRLVRASDRAYTGFLNKLRADVFDDLIGRAEWLGLNPRENEALSGEIAGFVNAGTGRGDWRSVIGQSAGNALNQASEVTNALFFSPRLMASRMTLMNPAYYVKATPFVRAEALKSLFTFLGVGTTVATLAGLSGASIEKDPRSADFMKIRIRNTRLDPWAGFQQYARMSAQIVSGEYKSTTTDRLRELGEGRSPTRLDILYRQLESKEAPIASFATEMLRGKTYTGEPVNLRKEVADRFIPMFAQDVMDLYREDPELIAAALPALFGVGVQTYQKRQARKLP